MNENTKKLLGKIIGITIGIIGLVLMQLSDVYYPEYKEHVIFTFVVLCLVWFRLSKKRQEKKVDIS